MHRVGNFIEAYVVHDDCDSPRGFDGKVLLININMISLVISSDEDILEIVLHDATTIECKGTYGEFSSLIATEKDKQ